MGTHQNVPKQIRCRFCHQADSIITKGSMGGVVYRCQSCRREKRLWPDMIEIFDVETGGVTRIQRIPHVEGGVRSGTE